MAAKDTDKRTWLIESAEEFKAFRDEVNNGTTFDGWTVSLGADIDLAGEENFGTIGIDEDLSFRGTFDGANFTISNLKITSTENNVGLFGYIAGATIRNFTLENADVTGEKCTAAVVGNANSGTIENVTVQGIVNVSGTDSVGAVAGQGYAILKNITVNVDQKASAVKGTLGYIGGDSSAAALEDLSDSKLTFKVTATDKPGMTCTTREVKAVLKDYHDARRDFNASGVSDIAVFDEASRTFSVIADQADGSFSKYQIDAPVTDTSWKCLGTGYMNSGKTQDVLWVHETGEVGVWLVDGAEKTHQTVAAAVDGWKFLAIADVTGDGRDNIIWQHTTGTVLAWESGANAAHSGDKVLGGVDTAQWNFAGTGDVTGDGAHDILWRHNGGLVGFWNSSDDSWVSLGSADEHWQILETGDFDNDGIYEILWQNDSGLVGSWDYDNGNVTWNSFGDANTLAGYDFSAVGDYNGDGFEDILWCDGNDNYKVWSIENNEKKESVDIKLA